MSVSRRRIYALLLVVAGLLTTFLPLLSSDEVSAQQITNRSLTLQAGTTDGGSKASGVVNHLFTFTVPNAGNANIGSIKFQYCTIASGACTTPTGLSTTSASMGSQNGATGFTMVNATNGAPYITRTAASVSAGTTLAYQLLGVTNPSGASCGLPSPATPNCTFFVRISTYTSTDTTGSPTDTGTVAGSTATQITVTGIMPESLIFCTGATVSAVSGVPDCSTASAGVVNFDRLFSPSDTATATSQMGASTNAGSGYVITINGTTLTSGSNTITGMSSATGGVHGTSQFGLNLKANTTLTSTPAIGSEVAPAANGSNLRGQAATGYNTVDSFKFADGDTVADSYNGGAGGTDAQIFTSSYIVNVPGSQPAGTYSTTLTYICTSTF